MLNQDACQHVEENGADFLLAMGRAAGGEEYATAQVHWIIGDCPIDYHNAVVRATLPPDQVEEVVAASVACLRRRRAPGSWHVGPAMQPADLGAALLRAGFQEDGAEIGMALDLSELPGDPPGSPVPPGTPVPLGTPVPQGLPAALRVEPVREAAQLELWRETLARGFGQGPVEANWVAGTFARLGYTGRSAWRHFLAFWNGEPAGTSTLFFKDGVAGIYFVFTAPHLRRRGIGAALTLAALDAARNQGARLGVLGASEMGAPVYRRLGFVEVCRIRLYTFDGAAG